MFNMSVRRPPGGHCPRTWSHLIRHQQSEDIHRCSNDTPWLFLSRGSVVEKRLNLITLSVRCYMSSCGQFDLRSASSWWVLCISLTIPRICLCFSHMRIASHLPPSHLFRRRCSSQLRSHMDSICLGFLLKKTCSFTKGNDHNDTGLYFKPIQMSSCFPKLQHYTFTVCLISIQHGQSQLIRVFFLQFLKNGHF